jgi:hypothetical protein
LAGRRWGLKISGWISGFPIVAGPILFFFAREQGNVFAAAAARKTLLGLLAFGSFVLAYGWASRRLHVTASILVGWTAFFLVAASVMHWETALVPSFGLAVGGLTVVGRLMPETGAVPLAPPGQSGTGQAFDLPLRMAATALLVLSLTGLAHALGPSWSGVLTPFPVATAVLAGFAQWRQGPDSAARFLSGSLMGMFGFSSFCLVLGWTLVPWGMARAFGSAIAAVLLVQVVVLWISSRSSD